MTPRRHQPLVLVPARESSSARMIATCRTDVALAACACEIFRVGTRSASHLAWHAGRLPLHIRLEVLQALSFSHPERSVLASRELHVVHDASDRNRVTLAIDGDEHATRQRSAASSARDKDGRRAVSFFLCHRKTWRASIGCMQKLSFFFVQGLRSDRSDAKCITETSKCICQGRNLTGGDSACLSLSVAFLIMACFASRAAF